MTDQAQWTPDQIDRLLRNVYGREITVHISEAMEERLRANLARTNADLRQSPFFADEDLFDGSDESLACVLLGCAERGLDAGDHDVHRLAAGPASDRTVPSLSGPVTAGPRSLFGSPAPDASGGQHLLHDPVTGGGA